ncbi:hypothetical protein DSO57_1016646 [Entomophthora muscae]|uniref:Uncharacterized protein n=1 Tax=Entomophthora muscae TaxID=34485 RepID=A0ACC2U2X5_9FUNG|nr:hypothetical protein DSO57_1016646 [Entomophthora muscae]
MVLFPLNLLPNSHTICPPVLQELKDRVYGAFLMTRDTLAGLTHAKGESKWAVTAYKDAYLDPVVLSGVYCLNSIELVWDVLEMLPFKNVLEMGWAYAAA